MQLVRIRFFLDVELGGKSAGVSVVRVTGWHIGGVEQTEEGIEAGVGWVTWKEGRHGADWDCFGDGTRWVCFERFVNAR